MIRVLRVSKSLRAFFTRTPVLQPGEHADLAVILSSDYQPWMDAAADQIHPVVVDSVEDATTFLRGMKAVDPLGPWPQEIDNDPGNGHGSQQTEHRS